MAPPNLSLWTIRFPTCLAEVAMNGMIPLQGKYLPKLPGFGAFSVSNKSPQSVETRAIHGERLLRNRPFCQNVVIASLACHFSAVCLVKVSTPRPYNKRFTKKLLTLKNLFPQDNWSEWIVYHWMVRGINGSAMGMWRRFLGTFSDHTTPWIPSDNWRTLGRRS